jgi:hypothetical protein
MRGGSQPQLIRCSDGFYYVVKFQNNPQHRRILVNELLAAGLAQRLGLPIPSFAVVDVSGRLIELSSEMYIELPRSRERLSPGLQFGSRLPANPREGLITDFLGGFQLDRLKNPKDFLGIFVFDKWTCNTDGRQVIFSQSSNSKKYRLWMIDQGFCFNEGEWTFPDAPKRSLFTSPLVYEQVAGIESFDPWLSRLESEITLSVLREVAETIPPVWYGCDSAALNCLIEKLDARRSKVRMLLEEVHRLYDSPFPNWPRQLTKLLTRSATASALA